MSLYELSNIRHGYRNRTVLVIDHLTIEKSAMTVLVGPNGAGKSTLLRLLALLESPVAGEVRVAGQVAGPKDRVLRRRIGWVMQQPYLFRGTALENVMLGLKMRRIRDRRARSLAALSRLGFDADPECSAEALSGGQRQLVALARCLVLEPDILLLDEPFNHLDSRSVQCLEMELRCWVDARGGTVIFSSHDDAHSRTLAESSIALREGRLVRNQGVNVFLGRCVGERFVTPHIEMLLPSPAKGSRAVVASNDIILSLQPLQSSIRNRFKGRVSEIAELNGEVSVTVLAGEQFECLVTRAAVREMGLTLGQPVWVNFKSTAIKVV